MTVDQTVAQFMPRRQILGCIGLLSYPVLEESQPFQVLPRGTLWQTNITIENHISLWKTQLFQWLCQIIGG